MVALIYGFYEFYNVLPVNRSHGMGGVKTPHGNGFYQNRHESDLEPNGYWPLYFFVLQKVSNKISELSVN